MCKSWIIFAFIFLLLLCGISSASAAPPVKIVSGVVSNVVSALIKWLWSLKSNTKTAVSSRSMMKFEGGYSVETVFDGNKLGIEPHSVDVSPGGELLLLDSENSNIYKISTPLSGYGRPKLIAGSPEGYSGHVDGKLREARMNHPKGLTVDDKGNIYIADALNMAIRKISDGVVTTIAGGKWGRGGGHVDGLGEDAKFSNDFDIVYIGSSCSLLVIDRGNQAIREIQLHDGDCDYQYDGSFHLGVAALAAATFFGYLLAVLQRRVQAMFSYHDDPRVYMRKVSPMAPYQRPPQSVRPPLIPNEDEAEKPDEGFFGSIGKLVVNTGSTVGEIFGGLFSGLRRKPLHHEFQHQYQQQQQLKYLNPWPVQESFVIPDEDEPPPLETTRTPTAKKTYPFMTKDPGKHQQLKQNYGFYNETRDNDHGKQQQQQMQMQMRMQMQMQMQQHHHNQQQQHHQRHYASNPKTYCEKSCETNEIVFGAVQEQDGRREAVVIKAVDYADPRYNHHNIRPRYNYVGYSHGF